MGCCSSKEMEDGITIGTEDYDKSRRYSAVSAVSKAQSTAAIDEDEDDGLAVDELIKLKEDADAEKAAFDGLQTGLN
eukprot:gene21426-32045_t